MIRVIVVSNTFILNWSASIMRHLFPNVVSYNRFVELQREVAIPLALFIKKVLLGKCTGISFVDSTPLRVCKNQRIHIHKVFKGIAQRGKCSMGWFFGFKLHLICNEKGELLNFMIGTVVKRLKLYNRLIVNVIENSYLCVGKKNTSNKEYLQSPWKSRIWRYRKNKSAWQRYKISQKYHRIFRSQSIIFMICIDRRSRIVNWEESRRSCRFMKWQRTWD